MPTRFLPPLAILLLGALPGYADLTVVQRTEGALNSGELTLRIKGDKARTDIAPQITMLTELSSGDSTTLNHNSRTYIRIPGTEAAKLRAIAAELKPGTSAEVPKLVPTGKRDKVENRQCEIFTWSVGKIEVTDWIASDYPDWQKLLPELLRFQNAGLGAAAQPLMPALEQFPGMVMKREMNFKGTKTTTTLLSTSDAVLDAKLFDLPEGYKEQPAPKFTGDTPPQPATK
jgi:hypothetical protein